MMLDGLFHPTDDNGERFLKQSSSSTTTTTNSGSREARVAVAIIGHSANSFFLPACPSVCLSVCLPVCLLTFSLSCRLVGQSCGINRVRCCPQQPGLAALWCDNGSVRLLDVNQQLQQLAAETEASGKAANKLQVRGCTPYLNWCTDWSVSV